MMVRRIVVIAFLTMIALMTGCRRAATPTSANPLLQAYSVEPDWNNAQHLIPLDYQQAQGQRIYYDDCVWCHSDSSPAGPSNRSNLNPMPALIDDGSVLNKESDEYLRNIITLGGSAMGKSAMMPPYGRTLSQDEIQDLIAFVRAVAQPPYQPPAQPGPAFSVR
jgi:mono/diheme cytochrome c family protein